MTTPQKGDQLPPNGAAHFYVGEVMHHRMKPVTHRFAYQVFSILIDLAKLDQANRTSPFFSVNRFNLMSFHEKDHGPLAVCKRAGYQFYSGACRTRYGAQVMQGIGGGNTTAGYWAVSCNYGNGAWYFSATDQSEFLCTN